MKAIEWAKQYVEFTQEDIDIILQARHSVLIHQDQPWTKKGEEPFDVTVGANDGAEICELVVLYILSLLAVLPYGKAAQFRDDGLMAIRGSGRQAEVKKKEVGAILKSTGIDITISANLKIVDFLDLTLDLNTGTYKTFNKPNNTPLYVHNQSSHPPGAKENIPLAINKRLSSNSSNEELFKESSPIFQQALKNSDYSHELKFEQINTRVKSKTSRKRNVIYFNPPWADNVKTRVGEKILNLVKSSFPSSNPLHKIFNKNTIKISYRTTPNMSQIISGHNRKLLDKLSPKQVQPCTCRKQTCPVQGKCKQECTIYQATVTHSSPETGEKQTNTYIGLAATTFYQRHQNHKTSFKDKNHSTKSELSKHIWKLKELGLACDITWKIIDKGKKFSPTSKSCKLCTLERYYLICRPDLYTLNKNKEFSDECLHKRFLRLSKVK